MFLQLVALKIYFAQHFGLTVCCVFISDLWTHLYVVLVIVPISGFVKACPTECTKHVPHGDITTRFVGRACISGVHRSHAQPAACLFEVSVCVSLLEIEI